MHQRYYFYLYLKETFVETLNKNKKYKKLLPPATKKAKSTYQ